MNPFTQSLEETFRGREAVVTSRDEEEYTGFIDRIDWNQRHVILHGAKNRGKNVGAAFISHAERIELAQKDMRVEKLPLSVIDDYRYSKREFSFEENSEFVESARTQGNVKSFPVVRERMEGGSSVKFTKYEALDGNKRLWAARQAGLEEHPVVVKKCGNLEAFEHFVWNHLDLPHKDGGESYSDRKTAEVLVQGFNDLGEQIFDIPVVRYNLRRLSEVESLD